MTVPFADIEAMDRAVRADLFYGRDAVVHGDAEFWTLPPLIGEQRVGDCEDWMRWTVSRFLAAGVDRVSLAYAICETPAREGHAVALVHSAEHGWVTCGDTAGPPAPVNATPYRWLAWMQLSRKGEWRKWA
ncbi:MAG: transglutaminase-like cysteine peptidase [Pseudomonadota bacterium]|nr:transglutaminase-like cysteine peptidase [Pseudomonadota bacterium]